QLVSLDEGLHGADIGEWRDHDDFARAVVEFRVLQCPGEFLDAGDRFEVVVVHLPVACQQQGAVAHSCPLPHASASSPGRVLPSRYSRLAPPPVEMWPKSSSAKPRLRTAAAESPPPTTVRRSCSAVPEVPVKAVATAFVPAARAGNSNTPIGPFQNTGGEAAMISAEARADSGPMSRPIPSAPAGVDSSSDTALTQCSASAEKDAAMVMSVGRTMRAPPACERSR